MNIVLENIGKRFNREWIFRNISREIRSGDKLAILGTNGSGKSTLLQIIAGHTSPTEGHIRYSDVPEAEMFRQLSYAAPYLELPEEMTWSEAIEFHSRFKTFRNGMDHKKVLELSGLTAAADKQIRNFSSGMKQRARLSLAILSDTPLLLLDEPSSNLDEKSIQWYRDLTQQFSSGRTILVCSNHSRPEYDFCKEELNLAIR